MMYPFFSLPRPSGRMKKKRKRGLWVTLLIKILETDFITGALRGIFYKGFSDFDTGQI